MRQPFFSRTTLNNAFALGGVIIILLQTLMMAYERIEVVIVVAGIMINQIGVWRLANRILPERRVYLQLRAEVDRFIGMVRRLNKHKVAGEDAEVQSLKSSMHESVDTMVDVADVKADES